MNDDMKMDFSTDIEAARKKRVKSFKLNLDNKAAEEDANSDVFGSNSDSGSSEIDTEASAKMMADDFSDKFSLHKYTSADQIDNENSSDEIFEGEERAIVDNDDEDPSLEISSFSNKEQKYKMDKAERKAAKEYKKKEKARLKEKAGKNGCLFRFIWLCMVVSVSIILGMFMWNGMRDLRIMVTDNKRAQGCLNALKQKENGGYTDRPVESGEKTLKVQIMGVGGWDAFK